MENELLCQTERISATRCIQLQGPSLCDCFDASTFPTTFEADTRQNFLSTQAFASPTYSNFCGIAQDRVCRDFDENHSCCCQEETARFQKCIFETVLPLELPGPLALETANCERDCSLGNPTSGAEPEANGLSLWVMIISLVVFAVAAAVCFFQRKRFMHALSNCRKLASKSGKGQRRKSKKKHERSERSNQKNAIETNGTQATLNASKASSGEFAAGFLELDVEEGKLSPSLNHIAHSEDVSVESSDSSSESSVSSSESSDSSLSLEDLMTQGSDPERGDSREQPPTKANVHSQKEMEYEEDSTSRIASKTAELKKKKHAIESWNKEHKHGSSQSLAEYLFEVDKELVEESAEETKMEPRGSVGASKNGRGDCNDEKQVHVAKVYKDAEAEENARWIEKLSSQEKELHQWLRNKTPSQRKRWLDEVTKASQGPPSKGETMVVSDKTPRKRGSRKSSSSKTHKDSRDKKHSSRGTLESYESGVSSSSSRRRRRSSPPKKREKSNYNRDDHGESTGRSAEKQTLTSADKASIPVRANNPKPWSSPRITKTSRKSSKDLDQKLSTSWTDDLLVVEDENN